MKDILHKDWLKESEEIQNQQIERVSDEHAHELIKGGHYIYVPKNRRKGRGR